jgi:hypothetical protein
VTRLLACAASGKDLPTYIQIDALRRLAETGERLIRAPRTILWTIESYECCERCGKPKIWSVVMGTVKALDARSYIEGSSDGHYAPRRITEAGREIVRVTSSLKMRGLLPLVPVHGVHK